MRALTLLVCLALAGEAWAQALPSEPISIGGGRVVFGGEIFGVVGEEDPGWFNYTDYEYSAFRNVRASLATEVRASRRLQLLVELRLDHGDEFSAYALFARVRPWPERRFDIQIGRVPPTFGAFTNTAYAYENLVIGQPLAYQYLLSIKTDAVPATADDLLRMRGNGWRSTFPVGNSSRSPGVPLVNTSRYDTGVQVHGVAGRVDWTTAVTTGSLSDPRLGDNNGRPQVSGRVVVEATPGIHVGASAAKGAWLDGSLDDDLPAGLRAREFRQAAVGVDAEVSSGAWLLRGEWLGASWEMPAIAEPAIRDPLDVQSVIVEGRYRIWPGVSLAARADRLWFSRIDGSAGPASWEADLRRIETAVSAAIVRGLTAKVAWQVNRRDAGRVRHDSLLAAQVLYWF